MAKPHTATTHSSGPLPEGCRPTAISVSVMIPMVFCASLVPCESATRHAVTVWPWRKSASTRPSPIARTMRKMSRTAQNAARPATTGDTSAGMSTLVSTAAKFTPSTPAPTMTAPTKPPNSACEELDGKPTSHVSRFHTMAPTKPAKMNSGPMLTWASLMMPPDMVLATSVERNAPTRLSAPAASTAVFGFRAPVAMEVAMALAVS